MFSSAAMQFEKTRGVTQVRVTPGLTHVEVQLPADKRLSLLRTLAERKIPVLMVNLCESGLSFAVRQESTESCTTTLSKTPFDVTLAPDKALISVIAGAMRDLSGIIAQIYDALHEDGVAIRQTSDAYDAVHVLVDGPDTERARLALERRFPEGGGV
jgi:aspartate kinase